MPILSLFQSPEVVGCLPSQELVRDTFIILCDRYARLCVVPVFFRNGYPVISVSLPSKGEDCDFMLNPLNETVGDFVDHLKKEDGGIERAILYTKQGAKIAKSTRLNQLFIEDFDLLINDNKYHVSVPTDCEPCSPTLSLMLLYCL